MPHPQPLASATLNPCTGTRVGEEVDVPVGECCPYRHGQRIDDETVSGVISSRQCSM